MTISKEGQQANDHDVKAWHDVHYAHTSPETKRSAWQRFENLQDPYNTENFVTGWVQMIGGDEYGNLIIEEVNERPAPQRITSTTPKTSYPYRRDRAWLLGDAVSIRSAIKLDGTNICQYSYENEGGDRFTTFKLRTRPFIPAHFRVILDQTLRMYPAAANLSIQKGEAMIYELHGQRNPMLIIYQHGIELTALCRRNPETLDIDPADETDPAFARLDCPLASATEASAWGDIKANYQRRQQSYSQMLRETTSNGERAFHGHEGEMLYVRFRDGDRSRPGEFTRLIKLKPPEIEEIHQAADHVARAEIEATARNIHEVSDEPGLRHLIMMLEEEWSGEQIARSMETIEQVLEETLQKRRFEDEVLEAFAVDFAPQDFRSDKGRVMNRLSGQYDKRMMQKVYSALDKRLP